jgi:hypothetical protein
LTFTANIYNDVTLCNNEKGTVSDQGLIVRFPNNTDLENIPAGKDAGTTVPADETVNTIVRAMLEALAEVSAQNTRNAFWHAYRYTCQNLASTLQLMNTLLSQHSTSTARFLLGTNNLIAKTTGEMTMVYPCTQLNASDYEVLPMNGTCTSHIRVNATAIGFSKVMYLDTTDNVLHPDSWEVECSTVEG